MVRKMYMILIGLLLLVTLCGFSAASANAETLEDALDSVVDYCYQNKPVLDNWEEVVGLSEAGVLDRFDLSGWSIELKEDSFSVDYASAILGLIAAGKDPQNYIDPNNNSPRDLVQQLADRQQPDGSFLGSVNNTIFSILALDKANGNYNVSGAVNYLISQQKSDGGFSLSGNTGDPDVTGVALMALAQHTDINGVSETISKAISYLHSVQLDSGGFASYGNENAESIAKVIQGLVACGEDLTKDWNKGDNNIIRALFNFWLPDGSFCHLIDGPGSDMATRQALMAIADLMNCTTIDYSTFVVCGNPNSGGDDPNNAEVRIRVEGNNSTLREGTVTTGGTALDALKELVGENNISYNQWGMVAAILGESGVENIAEGISTSWKYYVVRNGIIDVDSFSSGPGDYNVQDGDEIVFYIGAYDNSNWVDKTYFPVINISPVAPSVGQTLTITVAGQYYDWNKNDFSPVLLDSANIEINGKVYSTYFGQLQVPLDKAGSLTYRVYKQHADGYPELIRTGSKQLTVSEAVYKQVKVRVEGAESQLAAGEVNVSGTALDALKALVGDNNVDAPGGFINSIKGEAGKPNVVENTATSWKYYVLRDGKIDISSLGMGSGSYNVAPGDEIVFYIGAYDTTTWSDKTYFAEINIQPAVPSAGETVNISVPTKKYDWSQGLVDFQVDNIKLIINGREQIMANGQSPVQYTPPAGELKIRAEKYGQYPELVPAEISCTVKEKGSGGDINDELISARVQVIGKNRNTLYNGTVKLDKNNADVFHALVETGLSYKARYNNTYVYEIDGIAEDLSGTAGWKYKVNGEIPGIPAVNYQVQDGDEIIWYWAIDVDDDLGNSGPLSENVDPATSLINIPAERQEALQQARDKVDEQLRKIEENLSEPAYSRNELYNIVDLVDDPATVIGAENTMPEQERSQWAEILQNNRVDITQELKFEEDREDVRDEAGEVCLTVQKGALERNAVIEVKEENNAGVQAPTYHRFVSSVFNFGPEGTSFTKPATLRIKFTDLSDPENTILAWYNPKTKNWVPVPSVVDVANGEISGLITHFTKFAVFAREKQIDFFTDVNPQSYGWAQKEIEYLAIKGIVSGTGENKFDPARPVTRAEFVAMLVEALELDDSVDYEVDFSDIKEGSWYVGPVKAAVKAGLIKGFSDGTFRPADTVTREQIAAILVRVLNLQATGRELEFTDREKVSPWAREAVQAAVENQLISGYPGGTFKPQLSASRAQSAVLIYRLLKSLS